MPDSSRFNAVISMTLALATALLGWFAFRDRLGSPRPPDLRSDAVVPVSEQDVVARLWEDPLQAIQVQAPPGGANTASHSASALAAAVALRLNQGRVGFLIVPVPGTPFPDDAETRLRLRYSVQMALAQANLAPEDRNHLGCLDLEAPGANGVHVTCPTPGLADDSAAERFASFRPLSTNKVRVPYEWFGPRAGEERPVQLLVLWLPEELLSGEPLCRLAHLRASLLPDAVAPTNFAGLFVVGPRASDTLRGIAKIQDSFPITNHICVGLLSKSFRFYSPQATAPDALIGLDPAAHWSQARTDMDVKLRRLFPDSGDWNYFRNFIAPDDQLTDLLARELSLRGVDLQQDGILILAEADTSYGRSLPLAFQASVAEWEATHRALTDLTNSATARRLMTNQPPQPNLTFVRYLRGLDRNKGYTTSEPGAKKRAAGTPEETLAAALTQAAETPQGEAQLDYIERLADNISRADKDHRVKAVGILGSDLYDKLILLQAMRRRLSSAVFFTTDLDARLWHPNHVPYTRNLVVASAYGVETPRTKASTNALTFQMAPFRDCYQVAVFQAGLAAIADAKGAPVVHSPPPAPTIYELGRHGPVGLEPPITNELDSNSPASTSTSQARRADVLSGINWLGFGVVLAALIGIEMVRRWQSREHPERQQLLLADFWGAKTAWAGYILCGFLLLLAGFFWLINRNSHGPGGEPWAWGAGVSVWPTELVRLFTATLVFWMLLKAWQQFLVERDNLWDEFFARDQQDDTYRFFKGHEAQHPILRELQTPWPEPGISAVRNQPASTVEAREVFLAYVRKAGIRLRLLRSGIGAVLYFLLALGITFLAGGFPLRPIVRGELARSLDVAILWVAVLAFLLLVFYMLDAVRLAAKVLDRLAGPHTIWPDRLLDKLAPERGVQRDDLEGSLDVDFAAKKTGETGRLIYLPFLIQFLMLLSRNSYFDAWSWPPILVFIFTCNVLLTVTGWVLLRRAARAVRFEAMKKLEANLLRARRDLEWEEYEAAQKPKPGGASPLITPANAKESPLLVARQRVAGLERLKGKIEGEQRGAYARLIQDPALLAVLVPTGLLGIFTVLFRALFGGM